MRDFVHQVEIDPVGYGAKISDDRMLDFFKQRIRSSGGLEEFEIGAISDQHGSESLSFEFFLQLAAGDDEKIALAHERFLFADVELAHVLEEFPIVHTVVQKRAAKLFSRLSAQLPPE